MEQKRKPPVAVVGKINCGGAFDPNDNAGAWWPGETLKGTVLVAAAGRLRRADDDLQAEAVACLSNVRAAADQGIQRVEVDSDGQVLV